MYGTCKRCLEDEHVDLDDDGLCVHCQYMVEWLKDEENRSPYYPVKVSKL